MAKRKTAEPEEDSITTDSAQDSAISTRQPKRVKKTAVEDLNALNAKDYEAQLFNEAQFAFDRSRDFTVSLHFAKALPSDEFDACFSLIETTSRHDYENSSFGWHPKRKRREMREKEMRYLILRQNEQFRGFISFMLTHDSTPAVPVLYIYEIHLTEEARGKGLGQWLMILVEEAAAKAYMEKVMLTCFLSNNTAHNFYKRLGYGTDECSPEDRKTRNKTVKVDYVIMSKTIRQQQQQQPATTAQVTTNEHTTSTKPIDEANGITSMDCDEALRAWTEEFYSKTELDQNLNHAACARRELCAHNPDLALTYKILLNMNADHFEVRYKAAQDLADILREQMYHLKSQVADINNLTTVVENAAKSGMNIVPLGSLTITQNLSNAAEETIDMEKATEQVYGAYFTLMRKADEVDNRLDNVADREEEASLLEQDLNQREEDLDQWEADLHEREKALAEREERLMRSQERLTRRKQTGEPRPEPTLLRQKIETEPDALNALLRKRGPPPIAKVNDWLYTPDSEPIPADTIDDDQSVEPYET